MNTAYLILAVESFERLIELAIAHRNTRRLIAKGAIEIGRGHYPFIVLLHGSWLLAMLSLIRADTAIHWAPLAVYALLTIARIWVMASLGRFWTTRVITLPNAPLVKRGPYRYMRHPNYAVVIGEFLMLPLVFGLWPVAIVFSILNLVLLQHRVRIEESALGARRSA